MLQFYFINNNKFIFNRHSFYQTDTVVTIQIPIKGLKKEQVQVQTTDTTVCIFDINLLIYTKTSVYTKHYCDRTKSVHYIGFLPRGTNLIRPFPSIRSHSRAFGMAANEIFPPWFLH